MVKIKRVTAALGGFLHRHRIAFVLVVLLVIGVVVAGLHDVGIVLGILTAEVILVEFFRRWRRIRNFIFLFLASFFGIILLSFLDAGVVKPLVRLLGGTAAVNGTGFEVFNQIVSLFVLFFGTAGLITGLLGAAVLGIWRLVDLINKRGTADNT
jgi:hypothetical protein